jgi:hypothetical protein
MVKQTVNQSSYLITTMVQLFTEFKVCKSVHHHTIQINHQLDATISPVYYLDVYLQLNMFRASSRPSSGAATTAVTASGFTVGTW